MKTTTRTCSVPLAACVLFGAHDADRIKELARAKAPALYAASNAKVAAPAEEQTK